MTERQTASAVLMIRPAAFCANEQTAPSNHFQTDLQLDDGLVERAQHEFDAAADALREVGVEVVELQDTLQPAKPDAVFPNNWLSTHADGTAVLYPMLAFNRRLERRMDAFDVLRDHDFSINDVVDLSPHESTGEYLEGTGSLVLDRVNHIAYACRSPRTSEIVLNEFASRMRYRPVMFDARDPNDRAIYHTNVILCIGQRFAAVCFDCLSAADADLLRAEFRATDHHLVELSFSQITAYAGNMLELAAPNGPCIAMSKRARYALTTEQTAILEQFGGPILSADISTIERYGGGSLRCMLAEIHLPRRPSLRA